MASGLIRPVGVTNITTTTVGDILMWFRSEPKEGRIYIYDAEGSAYSMLTPASSTVTPLSDGGSLTGSTGNGAEYYDNYIYFAKNTTIARYGPLDGTPAFDGNYWAATLSKTALVDTGYPKAPGILKEYPNHVMKRHSDGRLYIADVVGNQGTIHYIKTTKSTVEGDTDDGSTFNALQFGPGLWPTAMENYGEHLAIALIESDGDGNVSRQQRAKIAFWDRVSSNFNQIIFDEFPDAIITGLKNINGVLYVISGNNNFNRGGFRISRYVGGFTFEEVYYSQTGQPPFPGAVDGSANRLLFASFTTIPETVPCVFSLGLQQAGLSNGLFNVMGSTNLIDAGSYSSTGTLGTALTLRSDTDLGYDGFILGWGTNGFSNGIQKSIVAGEGTDYSEAIQVWWSKMFRIGRRFRITKIRIPLAEAVAANMIVTPKIYFDEGTTTKTLTTINNTNFSGQKTIVMRTDSAEGEHNFWLELRFTGSVLLAVGLPITIEIELVND